VAGTQRFESGRRFTPGEVARNRPRYREKRPKKPRTLAEAFNIVKARRRQEEASHLEPVSLSEQNEQDFAAVSTQLQEEELLIAPQFVATSIKTRPGVYFVVDDLRGIVVRRNSLQSRPPIEYRADDTIPQAKPRATKPKYHTLQPTIIIDFASRKRDHDRRPRARRAPPIQRRARR